MLLPDVFGKGFFDDFMDDPWDRFFRAVPAGTAAAEQPAARSMRTDIKEAENAYEIEMDLPGFKKEDVSAELHDGYLTVTATRNENNDEKDEKGNYIRRERYSGSYKRSFFVGKDMQQEDIHAKFEDGVLKLEVPKDVPKKVEEKKMISIEG